MTTHFNEPENAGMPLYFLRCPLVKDCLMSNPKGPKHTQTSRSLENEIYKLILSI